MSVAERKDVDAHSWSSTKDVNMVEKKRKKKKKKRMKRSSENGARTIAKKFQFRRCSPGNFRN